MRCNPPSLVADIGGTNARFALVNTAEQAALGCIETLSTSAYVTLFEALDTYLQKHQVEALTSITLAVAAPIVNDTAKFTNASWAIDRHALMSHYQCDQVMLMNDFEAVALSLPELKPHEVHYLGETRLESKPIAKFGVVGAGTGLGTAALLATHNHYRPMGAEGGHTSFAPEDEVQQKILEYLRQSHGRVSYERLLSGTGIENIYAALSPTHQSMPAKSVFAHHVSETDATAREAVHQFTKILGQFAGDFALTTGSYDGIYLTGGVISKQRPSIVASTFRRAFEHKGRHRALMCAIPTVVITHPQPGLLGAAVATAQGPLCA